MHLPVIVFLNLTTLTNKQENYLESFMLVEKDL